MVSILFFLIGLYFLSRTLQNKLLLFLFFSSPGLVAHFLYNFTYPTFVVIGLNSLIVFLWVNSANKNNYFLLGFIQGLAGLVRYSTLIFLPFFILLLLQEKKKKEALFLILGFICVACVYLYINYVFRENPIDLGQNFIIERSIVSTINSDLLESIIKLTNLQYILVIPAGFLSFFYIKKMNSKFKILKQTMLVYFLIFFLILSGSYYYSALNLTYDTSRYFSELLPISLLSIDKLPTRIQRLVLFGILILTPFSYFSFPWLDNGGNSCISSILGNLGHMFGLVPE